MAAYRDGSDGARARLRALLLDRERELAALPETHVWAFRRRFARIAFGGALTSAGTALFLATAIGWLGIGVADRQPSWPGGALTALLIASWAAAAAGWLLARTLAPAVFRRRLARAMSLQGDLYASLEQARNVGATAAARNVVNRLERRSAALPLVGVSLLLPLTLHLVAATVLSGGGIGLADFDSWIALSVLLVGHSHLVLAVCGWRYARDLVAPQGLVSPLAAADGLAGGWSAWTRTVLSSTVPGLVFFGIPVFLVAVTGLFAPLAFAMVSDRVWREREVLDTGARD